MANSADFLAEPLGPLPDHVPDELVARYGRNAQRSVRYSRSMRYRLVRGLRQASVPLHNADVLSAAAVVFMWGIAALGLIGGIGYAIYLWPKVGVSMLGTVVILGALSLAVGIRAAKRIPQEERV